MKSTFIQVLRERALERKLISDLQLMDVLRRNTIVVFLDQQRQYARFVGLGNGSVGADDGFAFGVFEGAGIIFGEVFGRADDEARGNGEEGGFVVGEFEDEAACFSVS